MGANFDSCLSNDKGYASGGNVVPAPPQQPSTDDFVNIYHRAAKAAHQNACDKGFWDKPNRFGESIALMHSELSEALEGWRHGNPASDHIPEFTAVEEELADVIIRIMDVGHYRGDRVAEAVIAKMQYNAGREFKHGGKLI